MLNFYHNRSIRYLVADDDLERLTIEIESELKRKFVEKAKAEGFNLRGLLTKWIKKFLKGELE